MNCEGLDLLFSNISSRASLPIGQQAYFPIPLPFLGKAVADSDILINE